MKLITRNKREEKKKFAVMSWDKPVAAAAAKGERVEETESCRVCNSGCRLLKLKIEFCSRCRHKFIICMCFIVASSWNDNWCRPMLSLEEHLATLHWGDTTKIVCLTYKGASASAAASSIIISKWLTSRNYFRRSPPSFIWPVSSREGVTAQNLLRSAIGKKTKKARATGEIGCNRVISKLVLCWVYSRISQSEHFFAKSTFWSEKCVLIILVAPL